MKLACVLLAAVVLTGCASGPTDAPTPGAGPTCAPENTNCNGAAQPTSLPPATPPRATPFVPPTCAPENTNCNGAAPPSHSSPSDGTGSASCEAPQLTLTHDVTDTTRIDHIIPPGNLAGGGTVKAHSHVFPRAPAQVPVYAPVDLVVTQVTAYREAGEVIYLLHMAADCRTTFRVDHLASVSERLAALDPPVRDDTRNDDPPVSVAFAAGELLGATGGGPASSFFDFGMTDAAVTNANVQNRTAMFTALHAVCPYDRYTPELRAKYLALLGTADGMLAGNACRSPARDVPGTLQGSWFLGEANNDFGARAAIAPDLDGTVFFTLTAPSGERVDLRDAGARDPSTVLPGETVCYQGDTGPGTGSYGWARLSADGRSVELAWGSGGCPPGEPPGALTYGR